LKFAGDSIEIHAMSAFPCPFQCVAIGEDDLSRPMKFAILEVAHVDPAIPLTPLELPRAVYNIILEVATENSNLGIQRPLTFLLAIRELPSVANFLISTIVIPKSVHPPIHKFAPVGLPCSCRLVARLPF
jgi:hypothetical protein